MILVDTSRRLGCTIRSSVDCLIATVAIRNELTLWHEERDFDRIAALTGLRTRHPGPN